MVADRRAGSPEIVEVTTGRSGGPGGRRPPGLQRWLPLLAVGAVAIAIVGVGLLGPKRADAPIAVASPAPARTGAPAIADVQPPTLRTGGPPLDDSWVLLAGDWIDLATSTRGPRSGCGLERPTTLEGGRVVCVVDDVTRAPDLVRTTHHLSVITICRVGPRATAGSPADPPAAALAPVSLATLSGRNDLATGDPVAIAVAAGGQPDILLLAWAVLDADGYRIGLDRYRVEDGRAVLTGSREVATLPVPATSAGLSLGDLSVAEAPDGRAALVGFTVAGPEAATWRQLELVPVTPGRATRTLGPALDLPASATAHQAPGAQGDDGCRRALRRGARRGLGHRVDDLPRLCRAALGAPPGGARPRRRREGWPVTGGDLGAHTIDEIPLPPLTSWDPIFLAGNGVAIDRSVGRYFRWSPLTRTLWSIDLAAPAGRQAAADFIVLDADGAGSGPGTVDPLRDGPGARPILALDASRDRLYMLAPRPGGAGTSIKVVRADELRPVTSWTVSPEPFSTLTLSPDGRLVYVATGPRGFAGAPSPLVAVEAVDATTGRERLYAGWLPPGGDPPDAPIVR